MRTKHVSVLIHIRNKGEVGTVNPEMFLLTSKVVLLFVAFSCYSCFCHTVLSVPCSLAVTCLERADHLALLFMMSACVFVTVP